MCRTELHRQPSSSVLGKIPAESLELPSVLLEEHSLKRVDNAIKKRKREPNALIEDRDDVSTSSTLRDPPQTAPSATSSASRTRDSGPLLGLDPDLSPRQRQILSKVLDGHNVFFKGSAGTGKSVLLRAIIRALKALHESEDGEGDMEAVAVTASTGMAAIKISGSTLHSWAGIRLGDAPVGELISRVNTYPPARERWMGARVLVVDEISMIDGKLFTKLEHIGRVIRRNAQKPFGGLQLVLSGDFHQLPPVAKRGGPPAQYAFESEAWKKCFATGSLNCLKQVFRQRDTDFIRILEVRQGRISYGDERILKKLGRKLVFEDGVPAVELWSRRLTLNGYPTRGEVDLLNNSRLDALSGDPTIYQSIDTPGVEANGQRLDAYRARDILDSQTHWPAEITLKVGAVVMLLTNCTSIGLCNGSIGKVVDFMTSEKATSAGVPSLGSRSVSRTATWPVVEFVPNKYSSVVCPPRVLVPLGELEVKNSNGTTRASRRQVPLILAWGLTVHKAQGQTLDRVKVDLRRTFADGQAYVALSRATSMEGLEVWNFSKSRLKANERVIKWSFGIEGDH